MKMARFLISLILLLTVCFGSTDLFAQAASGKKAMKVDDYGRWRRIRSTAISNDGNWMTYAYSTPNQNDTLYVKDLNSDKETMIPYGSNPEFSDDSKWAAFFVSLSKKEADKLSKAKKPVTRKVQLLNLETGDKSTWDNADSFKFSKGSGYLVVKKNAVDPKAAHKGSGMILRNLNRSFEELIGSVSQFEFNKPGTRLAYTVDAADKDGNGLYIINLETGTRRALDNGSRDYSRMKWDEEGSAVAVLKGEKKKGFKNKENLLLAFTGLNTEDPVKNEYDPSKAFDFPKDFVISERGSLVWSTDLEKVFVGIKEQEIEPEKKSSDPVPNVDVWHWQDDRLQSVQIRQANRDKNFTYTSVFDLKAKRFNRLTDESMRAINLTRDGNWGVGVNFKPYTSDWKERQGDYYLVNTSTGERKEMFKGQKRTLGLSPDSKNFLYWKEGNVWIYKILSGETLNLTENAPVSFVNVEYDRPGTKPPYGVAGWTKDGNSVVLNHRYDLYLQPLDGSPAQNLTGGTGTNDEIVFRYFRFDREERFIDLSKPVFLTAYGYWTKKTGYYNVVKGKLNQLIYDDKSFGRPVKAKNADQYLFTSETFRDFPDYYVSDGTFSAPKKITNGNPQQSEYVWGKRILFEYTNKDGVRLQGTLGIPDTYKEGDKFPMLVQFYEKYSQRLHRYEHPVFRDTPQLAKFCSNGYLVMQPDIHFNTGTTHSDMLDCVEAAVKKVIELGYADPERVALHGHSFSGQGGAFIATQSKMFAAFVIGATATDLVADFNQLWKSAGTNQHRYDYYGQGRFGTNPFDDLDLYMQESAVYQARTMDTPLLLFHGTADGSVEWLQAVEFYNALRFNSKPVILCSYPGAAHHLRKLENQKDYQNKMEKFIDHYLKDKPAPEWMTHGIPFLKKRK